MERSRFDDYVRRFNAEDASAFDDYLNPDVSVGNGGLTFQGVDLSFERTDLNGVRHALGIAH